VIGIFLYNCSGDFANEKNDLEQMNIYGRVKSIKEFSYEAQDKFGEISKGNRANINYSSKLLGLCVSVEGSEMAEIRHPAWLTMPENCVRLFNDKGNLTEISYYALNGNLTAKSIYKYDSKGNKIELISFNSEGDIKGKIKYLYDDNSHIIEEVRYDLNGIIDFKFSYLYDNMGNKIEVNETSNSFFGGYYETKCSIEYKFDRKGNIIEKIEFNSDGSFRNKCTYIYDEKGKMIQKIRKRTNETDYDKYLFIYDDKSNIIEEGDYDISNQPRYVYKYKYEYDVKLNWIRRIDYENEILLYVIEREIEYY